MDNHQKQAREENVEEVNIHECVECNKSFRSGKALGGHMSSAHVQGNKDHESMKSKMTKSWGSVGKLICGLCNKDFPSRKSLFGHMRCHPEREWRGMEPPEEINDEEMDLNKSLTGWGKTERRGRMARDEKLDELVNNRERDEVVDGEYSKKRKRIDNNLVSVEEQYVPVYHQLEGAGNCSKEEEEEEETSVGGSESRASTKNKGVENEKERVLAEEEEEEEEEEEGRRSIKKGKGKSVDEMKVVEIKAVQGGEGKERFMCDMCKRSFKCHQALGGHMASHKKFKISIVNTKDIVNIHQDNKKKAPGLHKKKKKKMQQILPFDLNKTPDGHEQ